MKKGVKVALTLKSVTQIGFAFLFGKIGNKSAKL